MVEGNRVKTAFIAAGGSKKIKGQPKAFIDVGGKLMRQRFVSDTNDMVDFLLLCQNPDCKTLSWIYVEISSSI